jgi:energy-coupling factor transporter transmembrane protein EcfT
LILVAAIWLGLTGLCRCDSRKKSLSFLLLIATGSALSLFPQYFFFRPDPPHLSEMMCAFVITSVCAFGVALEFRKSSSRPLRAFGLFWSVILFAHIALYARYGVSQPWMGSIAMKKKGEQRVQFDNGVIAFLPEAEKEEMEELYEAVKTHSTARDYVVCFPYSPMINFMTNRNSYRFNLYVDNSSRPENFDSLAIQEIETRKPAVIAIDDVAMNLTESSRFSVWAAPTLAFIRQNYKSLGNFMATDIYAREVDSSGKMSAAGP